MSNNQKAIVNKGLKILIQKKKKKNNGFKILPKKRLKYMVLFKPRRNLLKLKISVV